MLNSQQQPLNSNENSSIPHRNREQYNGSGRGMNNRTRMLTTPGPTMTHPNLANRFHHFSCSMPETPNTCNVNGHFTNFTYQATENRGHANSTTPFRQMNTSHEWQGFYHRRSPRSNGSLYGTFLHEYYNHGLHSPSITINCLEAIPFGQARGTIYKGNLLSSIMIELTTIQAALSLIETFNGTKSKFKAWAESIEISGQDTLYIAFPK